MKRFFIMGAVLSVALPSMFAVNRVSAAVPVIAPKATIAITQKLTAGNIILSESMAKTLTESQLQSLMEVKGQDLTGLKLDGNTLATANAGLNGKDYIDIPVTWSTTNETAQAHLVVVSDDAIISSDRQKAINAYPVTLGQDIANTIGANSDQTTLDYYTQAKAYHSDGTVSSAALEDSAAYFMALKNAQSNDNIDVTYNFSSSDKSISKTVAISIFTGSLNFTSAPSTMDFGQLKVKNSHVVDFPAYDQDLVVTDTRQSNKNTGWTMFVKESQSLVQVDATGTPINGGRSLAGSLFFSPDGSNHTVLSSSNAQVQSQPSGTNGGTFNLSQNWGSTTKKGLYLDVPVTQQYAAKYQGELTWTLSDVPGNK